MSINRCVYAFLPESAGPNDGRADRSVLPLILFAGLAGLGWLAAAMLAGQALRDLIPSCC